MSWISYFMWLSFISWAIIWKSFMNPRSLCISLWQFVFVFADFNLSSCELDNFTFKVLYWVILYWYYIKVEKLHNTFTVPCEKYKIVSFASSKMKNIVAFSFPSWARFSLKLICCITFGSGSSTYYSLKSGTFESLVGCLTEFCASDFYWIFFSFRLHLIL